YRWVLTLKNNSLFSQQALRRIDRYFVPGLHVIAQFVNSSTGASTSSVLKIISSVDATAGGVAKATVVVEPNVTSTTFAGYTSSQKAAFQPTGGLVMVGANS